MFPRVIICLFVGFLGDSIVRGQSGLTLSRGEDGDQAAVGECGQWLDCVPHCQTGFPHGEPTSTSLDDVTYESIVGFKYKL